MRLLLAIWSVIAWSIAGIVQLLLAIVLLPLSWFIPFTRLQGSWPGWIFGRIPSLALTRYAARYHPDFDPTRPALYVMNHTSMLDGHVAIRTLPAPFCGIENAEHLKVPGYGWLMRMGNSIPVYKDAENTTAQLIEAARDRVSRGISILAFPEGHRTVDGTVRPFRTGVFVVAREAGLPVVPVALRGMFKVLPKGTWVVTPGPLEVWVGPPMETRGLDNEAISALARRAHAIISRYVVDGDNNPLGEPAARAAPGASKSHV